MLMPQGSQTRVLGQWERGLQPEILPGQKVCVLYKLLAQEPCVCPFYKSLGSSRE